MASRSSHDAQHPRPELQATFLDPGIDFKAVWARLTEQWLLPSNPLAVVDGLTVGDLRAAALEIFSAGMVGQAALSQRLVDLLGTAPDRSLKRLQSLATDRGRRTTQQPPDCSATT
jgi:hypothetical protein